MREIYPPTAADFAYSAAQDNEKRVRALSKEISLLTTCIVNLTERIKLLEYQVEKLNRR